jgi:hypothetical protein
VAGGIFKCARIAAFPQQAQAHADLARLPARRTEPSGDPAGGRAEKQSYPQSASAVTTRGAAAGQASRKAERRSGRAGGGTRLIICPTAAMHLPPQVTGIGRLLAPHRSTCRGQAPANQAGRRAHDSPATAPARPPAEASSHRRLGGAGTGSSCGGRLPSIRGRAAHCRPARERLPTASLRKTPAVT